MAAQPVQMEDRSEWLVIIQDLDGSAEKRKTHGRAHVTEMEPDRGSLWLLGGMILQEQPTVNVDRKVTGNVIIARAFSEIELLELLKKDVYAREGVWNMENVGTPVDINWSIADPIDSNPPFPESVQTGSGDVINAIK